jgi:hypothetical protein
MIEIYNSNSLKGSEPYNYYKEAIKTKLKYFVSIDNGFQGNSLLASLDEDSAGIIWAKDGDKIVACVSYHLLKTGKKIFTINFFHAESEDIYNQVNDYVEKFASDLDCYFIEEVITAKDTGRLNELEKIGYQIEFTLMFKKV